MYWFEDILTDSMLENVRHFNWTDFDYDLVVCYLENLGLFSVVMLSKHYFGSYYIELKNSNSFKKGRKMICIDLVGGSEEGEHNP